jgi:hypothetical protein
MLNEVQKKPEILSANKNPNNERGISHDSVGENIPPLEYMKIIKLTNDPSNVKFIANLFEKYFLYKNKLAVAGIRMNIKAKIAM